MEILDISNNEISSKGFNEHIIRLVKFTRLQGIYTENNYELFPDRNEVNKFISILHHHNTSLEELPGLDFSGIVVYAIENILIRNLMLKRVNALLVLQPQTALPIPSKSGIWYMAIANLAKEFDIDDDDDDDDAAATAASPMMYPGVSAIFKILQARPAIFEKQLKRPPPPAAAVAAATAVAIQQDGQPSDSIIGAAAPKHQDKQDPTITGNNKNGGVGGGDDDDDADSTSSCRVKNESTAISSSSQQSNNGRKRQRTAQLLKPEVD